MAGIEISVREGREELLDLVRGLSALAVLAGHLRAFVLVDMAEVSSPGLLTKAFYLTTGLGHQAVMVFFVLSGYFVGGSVVKLMREGRFSWKRYGVARLSRLWVVLIPALALTLVCDVIGRGLAPEAYAGGLRLLFHSGPEATGISLSPVTALGNVVFLQTVAAPVFGTNSPLWSLANEFWYYVLFPLLGWAVVWKRPLRALAAAGLFGFLLWWLLGGLAAKMGIWLFGVAAWVAGNGKRKAESRNWRLGRLIWRWLGAGVFALVLAGSKWRPEAINDWMVGGVFALWLPALAGRWNAPEWLRRLAKGLAEISYTLYVVHFPLLFLVAAAGLQGRQWLPDGTGLGLYAALLAGAVAVSAGWWWCFEKRTEAVRAWVQRRVG